MVGTIVIHNSDGEVLAPIGRGEFIAAKRVDIRIVQTPQDEDVPLNIRKAMVGTVIPTIFSSEQLNGAAPPGSRIAYGSEVVETLEKAGKKSEASQLAKTLKNHDPESEYTFLVFEEGSYEHIEKKS